MGMAEMHEGGLVMVMVMVTMMKTPMLMVVAMVMVMVTMMIKPMLMVVVIVVVMIQMLMEEFAKKSQITLHNDHENICLTKV